MICTVDGHTVCSNYFEDYTLCTNYLEGCNCGALGRFKNDSIDITRYDTSNIEDELRRDRAWRNRIHKVRKQVDL